MRSLEEIIEQVQPCSCGQNHDLSEIVRDAICDVLALAREQISDQGRPDDEVQRNIGLMVAAQVCDDLAARLKK